MKKIIYLSIFIILLGSFWSCKKNFLETQPSYAMPKTEVERDLNAINGVVDGIHNMMYTYGFGHFFGNGAQSLNAQLDMLGDDMINSTAAYYMGVYRWTDHRDIYGSINFKTWDFYYTLIQHANTVIEALETFQVSDLEKPRKAELLGEAYMIRAYAYGNLVQLFSKRYVKGGKNNSLGVILRLIPNYDPMKRSTVEETYTQINSDIKNGIENLKINNITNRKNRISLSAAYGIAARIALAQSNWDKAEEYATLAIKNKPQTVRLAKGNELVNGFNNWNCPEWIWAYRQADDQNMYYTSFGAQYSYNYEGYQKGLKFAINRTIFDPMGKNDVRRRWFVCLDLGDKIPDNAARTYFAYNDNGVPLWETTGQCIKFANKAAKSTFIDACIMRLGEFYYIKAEAEARLGNEGAAKETLNTVVQTRDSEYDCASFSGSDLINEILRNKRVDMYMEGVRFFDMKRLSIVPHRLDAANSKYMDPVRLKTFKDRNSGDMTKSIAKTPDAKEWQFVIPYNELKGNNLCKQNEL